MTKQELCADIGRRLGRKADEVLPVVEHFARAVAQALARGEYVEIRGFGRFHVVKHKRALMHRGMNRRPVRVPARPIPKFRAHTEFRRFLETKMSGK